MKLIRTVQRIFDRAGLTGEKFAISLIRKVTDFLSSSNLRNQKTLLIRKVVSTFESRDEKKFDSLTLL